MNRAIISIALMIFLTACAQSMIQIPMGGTGPEPHSLPSPTVPPPMRVEPSALPTSPVAATIVSSTSCRPIRIMPMGDSITYGEGIPSYGGYRNLLGALLESKGIQFDFVGSQKSGEESLTDPDNEGHPGWRIHNLREAIAAEGWLETYQPDIILLHIGSNDLRDSNQVYTVDKLSLLLDDILARLPQAHVVVATIIRTRWGSDEKHLYYNGKIPRIAASKGERVSVVNMQEILSKGDFIALYHPNPRGYDKMAHAWLDAILALGLGNCVPEG